MPPLTRSTPPASSSSASALQLATIASWRARNSGVRAWPSATALPAMTCISGPPCRPGKTALLTFARQVLVAQHQAGARAAERLVDGGGDDVGDADRRRVHAGGDEAGDVRHVHHEPGAHLVGDLAERREVDDPRVGGGAGDDQRGLQLARHVAYLVHVDAPVLAAHPVVVEVVELPGEVHLEAVRQVAAVRQRHRQHPVARGQRRRVGGLVGRRARVGLHVDVVGAEELLRAVDGELLDLVDDLAAAVVALAREALRVLVGEDRAHGLQHRVAGEVLARDHLQRVGLALGLGAQQAGDLGVGLGDVLREVALVVDEAHAAPRLWWWFQDPRVQGYRGRTTWTPVEVSAFTTASGSGPGRTRRAGPPAATSRRSTTADAVPGSDTEVELRGHPLPDARRDRVEAGRVAPAGVVRAGGDQEQVEPA